jgi:hypothetical protein
MHRSCQRQGLFLLLLLGLWSPTIWRKCSTILGPEGPCLQAGG